MHASALTRNGYETLNMLLGSNHAQMIDVWAYRLENPKHSDTNNLADCCIDMQDHATLQLSCHRKYNHIEQTRMHLNNLDHPSFKEVKTLYFMKIEVNLLQTPA